MKSIFFALMLIPAAALAGVYRCTVNGAAVYTDKPCADAKPVDVTNGKPPTERDRLMSELRAKQEAYRFKIQELEEERKRLSSAAQARRDADRQRNCMQKERHQEWVEETANQYKKDKWWQNQAQDGRENFAVECQQ